MEVLRGVGMLRDCGLRPRLTGGGDRRAEERLDSGCSGPSEDNEATSLDAAGPGLPTRKSVKPQRAAAGL